MVNEPTSALDMHSGTEIEKLFKELNEESRTLIIVTHDNELDHRTKRIVRFKDGMDISDVAKDYL